MSGLKLDIGKLRYDLLPPGPLAEVVAVLTYGATKYAPGNWQHVRGARWRYFAAAMRHLWAWWGGSQRDEESGQPHLAHAAACLLFLLSFEMGETEWPRDEVQP